ncbi:nucleotidyltransferase family protein [Marinicauda algicola]|uniref:nucleotidyltransferase family protein n=1 Tax=Marinicauda algicola TaxID=2029849 RepID=UPI00130521EF|nr:nucleotidyltransferase family protein [Marinicauda algicola]
MDDRLKAETGASEAVVLAGGLGTRLRASVPDLPKPLAPVAGRPFLEYLLVKLKSEGVRRVILSVGYRHEAIVDHFGSAWNGLDLVYAVEESPLGTGGALALALEKAQREHVLAMNGDTLVDADFRALCARRAAAGAPFAMLVREIEDSGRFGVCQVEDGRLTGFAPGLPGEPGWINAGVYCLASDFLSRMALKIPCSFEADILPAALDRHTLVVEPTRAPFIDIGVPESYAHAQNFIPEMARRYS